MVHHSRRYFQHRLVTEFVHCAQVALVRRISLLLVDHLLILFALIVLSATRRSLSGLSVALLLIQYANRVEVAHPPSMHRRRVPRQQM